MKLFVWDFHGVLERDNELAVLKITNTILKNFGYKERLTKTDNYQLTGRKWYQYFEFVLPGESVDKHIELQEACFTFSSTHPEIIAKHIKPNKHAKQVLKKIAKHHEQIVISNTKPASLQMFLKAVKLDNFFGPDKYFAADAHTKDSIIKKQHLLSRFLTDKKYDELIFIGDSAEDVELVNISGGKTYLYAHPGKSHRVAKADFKITDLREVLREV